MGVRTVLSRGCSRAFVSRINILLPKGKIILETAALLHLIMFTENWVVEIIWLMVDFCRTWLKREARDVVHPGLSDGTCVRWVLLYQTLRELV